jgi:hypothetical protein
MRPRLRLGKLRPNKMPRSKDRGILFGAVEQNLLKLFEYIINNPLELRQLNTINKVDTPSERIIY